MAVIIGGVLGLVVGAGVWHGARRLLGRYQPQSASAAVMTGGSARRESGRRSLLLAAVVHAGLALFGAYLAWRALPFASLVFVLVVTGLLASVSLIDLQVRRVPDVLCLALLLCALAQALWRRQPTLAAAGLGSALAGGLFLLLALIRRGALGAGDVKLMAALGALLGYPLVLPGIAWGVIAGGVAALFLLVTRKAGRKDPIAYAPYLALGAWIIWIRSLLVGL